MTLRTGRVIRAEGAYELTDELDISGAEMFAQLSESHRETIRKDFNEFAEDSDEYDPVESFEDLPEFVYDDWIEWYEIVEASPAEMALRALDARDQEYIHTSNHTSLASFHTVVEL